MLFDCDSVQANTYGFLRSASDFRMAELAGDSLPSEELQAAIAIIHV